MLGLQAPSRFEHYAFDKTILRDIKELKPDNWHGILYLAKDYLVIAAFVYFPISISWWIYPLSVLIIGAHQRGMSTLLHDSAHGVLARNRALNFLLGTLPTAWLIFQRHFAYRESHVLTHHPYLGRPDRDPDLEFFIGEGVFATSTDASFMLRIVILPLLGSKTWAYLKYLVRNRYRMLMQHSRGEPVTRVQRSDWKYRFDKWGFYAFWATVAAASLALDQWSYVLLFWVIPYLTSFHTLGWFIELSEHCSSVEDRSMNLLMARNRRSRHLERWLTDINNDSHHLDHHLDPTTPFWCLPEAHRIRLRDPQYARHCGETGGIFQWGPAGEPSIIALLRKQNRERQEKKTRFPRPAENLIAAGDHA